MIVRSRLQSIKESTPDIVCEGMAAAPPFKMLRYWFVLWKDYFCWPYRNMCKIKKQKRLKANKGKQTQRIYFAGFNACGMQK